MTDVFDSIKRSEIMSRIRSKNTMAELIVFRSLRSQGIYFQKHYSRAPGKPDIALPRKKLAVFIDGDFWHGKNLNKFKARHVPGPNNYWIPKIERNMQRDKEQERILRENGWKILRVWDSDIKRKKTQIYTIERITDFLTQRKVSD